MKIIIGVMGIALCWGASIEQPDLSKAQQFEKVELFDLQGEQVASFSELELELSKADSTLSQSDQLKDLEEGHYVLECSLEGLSYQRILRHKK